MKTWSDSNSIEAFLNEFSTNIDYYIQVNFVVNTGESLYFSFSCFAELQAITSTDGYVTLRFYIDSAEVLNPFTAMGVNSSNYPFFTTLPPIYNHIISRISQRYN